VRENDINNESRHNASILLVEDDDVTAYMLTYLLKREGYDVTCFSDGQQAYDAINEDNPFSLALLDVMIPYRNGIELISQIRSLPSWDNTPVIMISGKTHRSRTSSKHWMLAPMIMSPNPFNPAKYWRVSATPFLPGHELPVCFFSHSPVYAAHR